MHFNIVFVSIANILTYINSPEPKKLKIWS